MAEQTDLEKCNFRKFTGPVTLTVTLDRVIRHTVVHHSLTSMYTPNFTEIRQTFCGRTYGRTYGWTDVPIDGRTFPPLMLLGRLGGVELKETRLTYTLPSERRRCSEWAWLPSADQLCRCCTRSRQHAAECRPSTRSETDFRRPTPVCETEQCQAVAYHLQTWLHPTQTGNGAAEWQSTVRQRTRNSASSRANSASYPQQDGKWAPAKVRWCSAAREWRQVRLIPLVDKRVGGR